MHVTGPDPRVADGARSVRFLVVLGMLGAAGLLIWPGCAWPALPAKRIPLSNLRRADFKHAPTATQPRSTRAELEAKLGAPDEYFEDLRVAAYRLNEVKRKRLWLLFFVLPVGVTPDPDQMEVGFVEYNDAGQVRRMAVRRLQAGRPPLVRPGDRQPDRPSDRRYWSEAARWVQEPDPIPVKRK
jgi:hypothetical protein